MKVYYQITSSRWIYTPLLVYEVYSMRLSLTSSSPLKYPPKRGLFSLPCIEIFTSFLKYIKMWSEEWRCLIPSPVKVVGLVRDFDAISFHWYWMGLMWHIQPLTLWSLWWLRDEIISRFCIIISIIWITSNLTFSTSPFVSRVMSLLCNEGIMQTCHVCFDDTWGEIPWTRVSAFSTRLLFSLQPSLLVTWNQSWDQRKTRFNESQEWSAIWNALTLKLFTKVRDHVP